MMNTISPPNGNAEAGERFFDPFRAARTPLAKQLVRDVIQDIEAYEQQHKLRKRSRKDMDRIAFEATVEALVCDLAHATLTEREPRIAISLSNRLLGKRSRYRSLAQGKATPAILEIMASQSLSLVELNKGSKAVYWRDEEGATLVTKGRVTSLRPGRELLRLIDDRGIGLEDLGRSELEETIVLKGPKDPKTRKSDFTEYEDDERTRRWRSDMTAINRFLDNADITVLEEHGRPFVDPSQRQLRRVFNNGRFDEGGRLFFGFWQGMGRSDRLERILISGEPVCELDYGQMAIRLLYGLEGKLPPSGDLYAVPGYEQYREGLKLIINSALYSPSRQFRMPKEGRSYFPKNVSYAAVLSAVEDYHSAIRGRFFQGIGMHLLFLEAEVMVTLLLRLKDLGVVALPIHDGILVAQSREDLARTTMETVFREKSGLEAQVKASIAQGTSLAPPFFS